MSNFFFSVGSLSQIPTRDHDLLTGLTDDDHTQYALLAASRGLQTFLGNVSFNEEVVFKKIGNNFRMTGGGTTALDGGFFTSSNGDIYLANYDADRGWLLLANGDIKFLKTTGKIDLSNISAGTPNFKITETSDTPAGTPAGYLEVLSGSTPKYIQLYT